MGSEMSSRKKSEDYFEHSDVLMLCMKDSSCCIKEDRRVVRGNQPIWGGYYKEMSTEDMSARSGHSSLPQVGVGAPTRTSGRESGKLTVQDVERLMRPYKEASPDVKKKDPKRWLDFSQANEGPASEVRRGIPEKTPRQTPAQVDYDKLYEVYEAAKALTPRKQLGPNTPRSLGMATVISPRNAVPSFLTSPRDGNRTTPLSKVISPRPPTEAISPRPLTEARSPAVERNINPVLSSPDKEQTGQSNKDHVEARLWVPEVHGRDGGVKLRESEEQTGQILHKQLYPPNILAAKMEHPEYLDLPVAAPLEPAMSLPSADAEEAVKKYQVPGPDGNFSW
mmetsp:Transcript_2604/g.4184  ORF Transcript_2604/g.4184 Transcript_2604/m.4184 type:complete len:337 (+) Transcript_2604:503-1513(+)